MKYTQSRKIGKSVACLLSSVSVAVFATGTAYAQDATEEVAAEASDEGEAIVVTGIRGSLARAADIKRDADQVMDVITSEDVGKLPDANVAEALQRVTGVQITRVFGEGQSVSVRGLQQVRVEVDGRTLLGWSARLSPPENEQLGRSSGLDSVPSGLFGRLEVRKSPLASQVEGGLGGTVNLATPKPFDFKKPTASIKVDGTYSEGSKKFEPGVTGFATTRFADDRIGVLIAADFQQRTNTIQALERNNFFNRVLTPGVPAYQVPTFLQYETFVVDRSRLGLTGAVQFEVTPDFTLTLDGIYSKLKTSRRQDFINFRLPTTGTIVTNPVFENNFLVAGTSAGTVQTAGTQRNEPTTTYLAAINGKYDDGQLRIVGDASYTRGTLVQTIEVITLQSRSPVTGTYDFRAGPIPSLVFGTAAVPFDATNYANFQPAAGNLRSSRLYGLLDEYAARLDVSYETNGGVTLAAGVRYSDLGGKTRSLRSVATPARDELLPYLANTSADSFLNDIPGNFPRVFLSTIPDFDFVRARALAAQTDPDNPGQLLPNRARDYTLNEKTLAGYLEFSAEGNVFGMPAKMNAGVRLVKTDLSVDSFIQTPTALTLRNNKNSYTNVLPSANLTVNASDNFLVRLSASQTMQRAGIAELAPITFVNPTNNTATGGNADLKPTISTQADVSFEYYMGRTSLISGAVFYKDVSNFVANQTVLETFPGFESLGPIPSTKPGNVASAKVKGFEVGVQQFLDFLPSPLDGLGFIANFTYSDAVDSNGFPLVAVSKNSYNLIGLYEKGPFSARIAYNYRDEAVFEFTEGRPSFVGARSQLDAQLGFDLTENLSLQFQAQNLMPKKSATVEYSLIGPVALNSYALSERRFSVGARMKF